MTKTCPNCNTENEPDSRFCEACGSPLSNAPPARPRTIVAKPSFASPPEKESVPKTSVVAKEEAAVLPTTAQDETPALPVAPSTVVLPKPGGRLQFANNQTVYLRGQEEYFVGRTDPANDWYPAVDMAPHGGETGGVSRRHAHFVLKDGRLHLIDLNSTNGTYCNDEKLEANRPCPLDDGDQIRFGQIAVTYYHDTGSGT